MLKLKLVSLLLDVLYKICRVPYYTEIYRDKVNKHHISLQHYMTNPRALWIDIDDCREDVYQQVVSYLSQNVHTTYIAWSTYSGGWHIVSNNEYSEDILQQYAYDLIRLGVDPKNISYSTGIPGSKRRMQGQRISMKDKTVERDLRRITPIPKETTWKTRVILYSIKICKILL